MSITPDLPVLTGFFGGWRRRKTLSPREFVGTCGRYYFIFNTLKAPSSLAGSEPLITIATLKAGLWLLPLAPLGAWAGAWLNRRLNARMFNIVIYVILGATSISLVVKSV